MGQRVSGQHFTPHTRTEFHSSTQVICGRQNGIGTCFTANTSVLPCHYCSTKAPQSFFHHRQHINFGTESVFNPLTPNGPYRGRTAPLTSKRCILSIYSSKIGTEYFKHSVYSPFFPLQNAVCFIILTYLVLVLFTFYIQGVPKLKNNFCANRLTFRRLMSTIADVPHP